MCWRIRCIAVSGTLGLSFLNVSHSLLSSSNAKRIIRICSASGSGFFRSQLVVSPMPLMARNARWIEAGSFGESSFRLSAYRFVLVSMPLWIRCSASFFALALSECVADRYTHVAMALPLPWYWPPHLHLHSGFWACAHPLLHPRFMIFPFFPPAAYYRDFSAFWLASVHGFVFFVLSLSWLVGLGRAWWCVPA